MSKVKSEVAAYEERLRLAVMGPDPTAFEELLADNVVLREGSGVRHLEKPRWLRRIMQAKAPFSAASK